MDEEQLQFMRDQLDRHDAAVATAKQDLLSAYERLAEAEVAAIEISIDDSGTASDRAEAETTVDIRLNSVADWAKLLRNRLIDREQAREYFEIEQAFQSEE